MLYVSRPVGGNSDYIAVTKEEREHFPWVMEQALLWVAEIGVQKVTNLPNFPVVSALN